jgi:hypothetical protein
MNFLTASLLMCSFRASMFCSIQAKLSQSSRYALAESASSIPITVFGTSN